jgi:hypothetical protein
MRVMADTFFVYFLYVCTFRRHCLLKHVNDEKAGEGELEDEEKT